MRSHQRRLRYTDLVPSCQMADLPVVAAWRSRHTIWSAGPVPSAEHSVAGPTGHLSPSSLLWRGLMREGSHVHTGCHRAVAAKLISLAGRTAVITGGAKGLGHAIARRLAEAGASVLIGDIDETAPRPRPPRSARFGRSALSTPLDVADGASISAAADLAVAELGGIDIWVNNAGIYPSTPALDLSDAEWSRVIGINLGGTFIGCREAARRMVGADHGGVIVNLSSVAGIRGRVPA